MGHLGPRDLFFTSTLSTGVSKETEESHPIQRGCGQGFWGGEHLGTDVLSPSPCACLSRCILPGSVKRARHWAEDSHGGPTWYQVAPRRNF